MSFVYQNKASEARKKEQDSLFGLPAVESDRPIRRGITSRYERVSSSLWTAV